MTHVMRARTLSDLLGAVPALFGFHPRDSLVALCLGPPSGRVGFRLRCDLPPPGRAAAAAAELAGHLVAQRPDAVALVVYGDASQDVAGRAVVAAMTTRLEAHGVMVAEAVRYDGDRYVSYVCDDPSCCPPDGVACDAGASSMLAEAILAGAEVLPDRESLVRRFAPVTGAARRESEAATRAEADVLEDSRRSLADVAVVQRGIDRVLPLVERATAALTVAGPRRGAGLALEAADVATLSVWTSLTPVRDLVWARIGRRTADGDLSLWREVATRAVPPFEAAPLALAAFAAWAHGDGAQARCALDRVAEVRPGYPMATLLERALLGGLDPRTWGGLEAEAVLASMPGLRLPPPAGLSEAG